MSTHSSPPSSLRPTPTDSGTGKYVALIVVLGAGSAGLYAWRSSHSDPVAAPTPSASAAIAAAHAPHDEPPDIPPPPPVPEAGTGTGSGSTRTAVNIGDGCAAASCGGAINADLSAALAFRAKTAHKCYDEALAQDSTLKGQVVLNVRVGANGTICSAAVQSSDLANGGVAACIANKYRQGARLPSPLGGCIDVNVPMKLLPPH